MKIEISNYKCFGAEPQGFDQLLPINVLIGRNNSGKSSLLDVIQMLIEDQARSNSTKAYPNLAIHITIDLLESELRDVFRSNTFDGEIQGNHWLFGEKWIGKTLCYKLTGNGREFVSIDPPLPIERPSRTQKELTQAGRMPFPSKMFRRVYAERDVSPELDGHNSNEVSGSGSGVTNRIQRYLNKADLPSNLVEIELLNALNEVMHPDSSYSRILVQQLEDSRWEVFLEEDQKGQIAISRSGSGLKTILIVLVNLILVPHAEGRTLSTYVMALEELENNLHPALQRRLFLFLRKRAVADELTLFITTHSHVVIDLFNNDSSAQLYHLTRELGKTYCRRVMTYVQQAGILDDLDIRASDLLQSNGVIWVEGPSDRLYINRWIELYSGGKIMEGHHYQCVFYGGRLLAHLIARPPADPSTDLINILLTNRNMAIVIDSDKKHFTDEVTATKLRIRGEVEAAGGFCWITSGREIEHYIPKEAVSSLLAAGEIPEISPYDSFSDYLENIKSGEGSKYLRNKVMFAEKVRSHLSLETLAHRLDWNERLGNLVRKVESWNAS